MKPLLAFSLPVLAWLSASTSTPLPAPAPAAAPVHCQVPCGIYGDTMRIDMLLEDFATIEKAMGEITKLEELGEAGNRNQLVRWVMTKDEHAQKVQDQIASYWLAQRIKAPAEDSTEALERYHRQLALLHGVTVKAMKCKQTVDTAHVKDLRALVQDFSATYFSKEDLEHLEMHGKDGH